MLVSDLNVVLQASHTGGSSGMPEWMKRMNVVVEASGARKAVRLFLVKVVVHVERRHAEREAAGQQATNSPGPASPQVSPGYVFLLPLLLPLPRPFPFPLPLHLHLPCLWLPLSHPPLQWGGPPLRLPAFPPIPLQHPPPLSLPHLSPALSSPPLPPQSLTYPLPTSAPHLPPYHSALTFQSPNLPPRSPT